MWLCSDEVEEKPRLHTLHLNGLLELGVTMKEEVCKHHVKYKWHTGFRTSNATPEFSTLSTDIPIKERDAAVHLCVFRWIFR